MCHHSCNVITHFSGFTGIRNKGSRIQWTYSSHDSMTETTAALAEAAEQKEYIGQWLHMWDITEKWIQIISKRQTQDYFIYYIPLFSIICHNGPWRPNGPDKQKMNWFIYVIKGDLWSLSTEHKYQNCIVQIFMWVLSYITWWVTLTARCWICTICLLPKQF